MGAISAVASTIGFTELARAPLGAAALPLGTLWFGVGSATLLSTNRLPFALGAAFAMAAVLALQRDRRAAGAAARGAVGHLQPRGGAVRRHGRAWPTRWRPAARACRSSAGTGRPGRAAG